MKVISEVGNIFGRREVSQEENQDAEMIDVKQNDIESNDPIKESAEV